MYNFITCIFSLFNFTLSNDVQILKRLGNKYGRGIVKEVRKIEKAEMKMMKTKCDREFLHVRLIYHLIPKFDRFKLSNEKYMKHQIYRQQQRKYLLFQHDQKSRQGLK